MDILVNDFIRGFLVFLRIAAILFTVPVFSQTVVPVISRLFLSIIITYMIMFSIHDFNYDVEMGLIPLAIIGIKEMLTGIIIGFSLNFVFYGFSYAGLLIGNDMGLGAASMFDMNSEAESNIIGSVLSLVATLVFILINGHHFIISALGISFKLIPLGHYSVNGEVVSLLIKYAGGIFIIAVKISAPIIVSFFLLNVASGVMARVIPQMQILFVMFPLKIGLGFLLLSTLIPAYVYIMKSLLVDYEDKLLTLIKAMST
ncbi:MAG: flagellar biosynthetic protein FliR [Ignavibacteria bacterium]|nr:flagellar biosynthetic protein FliR [Ignavibacteria bacterium]